MSLSPVTLKIFKNTVERILHVPGNFTKPPLEMAVVIDGALDRERVKEYVPELLGSLKRQSEVFRNVRLNVVEWKTDERIETQVRPLSYMLLSGSYGEYEQVCTEKHLEKLAAYLKLFCARSKLIILITDGSYLVGQEEALAAAMRPFLEKKLMQVVLREDGEADIRYRL